MFPSGFFMIHNTPTCGQHNISIKKLNKTPKTVNDKTYPNWRDGNKLFVHFSICVIGTSKRGEITPHLFSLPVKFTTIFPLLWSSTISNSPIYPCFIITVKNLMMTFEHGRIKTCLLPRFSALLIDLSASLKTFIRTMSATKVRLSYK